MTHNRSQKTLIVVGGPTASGKTALGISLAQHYHTSILSADSRQFYKELNIGVARPSTSELETVKHHFIAHKSIHDYYSAGEYERDAIKTLNKVFETNDCAVMVGGSGLFINAVLHGFHEAPKDDGTVRNNLHILYNEKGIDGLINRLTEIDPVYAQSIDNHNPQRLMRAIERVEISGRTHDQITKPKIATRSFKAIEISIDHNREKLYDRINQRVDWMMQNGLLEEVKALESFKNLNALKTVGYAELFAYLDGKISLAEAVEQIKQNTRRYAKRQVTWFKNKSQSVWFKHNELDKVLALVEGSIKRN